MFVGVAGREAAEELGQRRRKSGSSGNIEQFLNAGDRLRLCVQAAERIHLAAHFLLCELVAGVVEPAGRDTTGEAAGHIKGLRLEIELLFRDRKSTRLNSSHLGI